MYSISNKYSTFFFSFLNKLFLEENKFQRLFSSATKLKELLLQISLRSAWEKIQSVQWSSPDVIPLILTWMLILDAHAGSLWNKITGSRNSSDNPDHHHEPSWPDVGVQFLTYFLFLDVELFLWRPGDPSDQHQPLPTVTSTHLSLIPGVETS